MFEESANDDYEQFNAAVGLTIAAEIVRKMKGTIKVGSKLGEGTEFNVSSHRLRMCVLPEKNFPIWL